MAQWDRIRHMEALLDRGCEALEALQEALDVYAALRPQLKELADYYEGPLWLQDLADDEAGLLPPELKRGVLSQDAVYDLLQEQDALLSRMGELADGS